MIVVLGVMVSVDMKLASPDTAKAKGGPVGDNCGVTEDAHRRNSVRSTCSCGMLGKLQRYLGGCSVR